MGVTEHTIQLATLEDVMIMKTVVIIIGVIIVLVLVFGVFDWAVGKLDIFK